MSREIGEQKVIRAALDLFDSTNAATFVIPIPNTSPVVYVAAGSAAAIMTLLRGKDPR